MGRSRPLPQGTVTFLFSDVEGSTRMLDELGAERYSGVLADHRRLVRAAVAAHEGVEVDTQGDAFAAAFGRASDAVAAAEQMQRSLARGPVSVRIGLHTGEPLRSEDGYVGIVLHQAARVCAAGHGGQVLLSQPTRDLVDVSARDLGEHRLKDLLEPQRLYQLGTNEFPPLRTLNWTSLPVQATPFLGRARELGQVLDLLGRPWVRLLTLTGPGGSGKTRLALQAAADRTDHYPDGVFYVSLLALRDPELLDSLIAQAVGARGDLGAHLAPKQALLVLDNFEQLVGASTSLAVLLERCPTLNVLVTSRETLHLAAEHEYRVAPFVEEDAVAFFSERARAVKPDFSGNGWVLEICRRLDCLPLALELAAARVNVLDLPTLLKRLERRLPLLTGGPRDAPTRQRTLRATIEWSYELLGREENQLFARLAVFVGGCALEAAEQVCGADLDTLASLVDKSLLEHRGGRLTMLDTVREYADERLRESGEATELRRRHAEYYLSIAEEAIRPADGESTAALRGASRVKWAASTVIPGEEANLRLAVAWGLLRDRRRFPVLWRRPPPRP
jgi:predicted ATPase/class 3 adenylate cyclase